MIVPLSELAVDRRKSVGISLERGENTEHTRGSRTPDSRGSAGRKSIPWRRSVTACDGVRGRSAGPGRRLAPAADRGVRRRAASSGGRGDLVPEAGSLCEGRPRRKHLRAGARCEHECLSWSVSSCRLSRDARALPCRWGRHRGRSGTRGCPAASSGLHTSATLCWALPASPEGRCTSKSRPSCPARLPARDPG